MKRTIISSCLFMLLGVQLKAQVCFAPAVTYVSQPAASGIATGDLNNDGFNDIVTASFSNNPTNGITVFLNDGAGNFTLNNGYTSTSYTSQVELVDLNQDGNLDVIATATYFSAMLVYLGNGDGTLNAYQSYPTGSVPFFFAVGDVNNDGLIDIVSSNYSSETAAVLLNNGSGGFLTPVSYSLGAGSSPRGITLMDFNSDGKLDIADACDGLSSVAILLNNGNGTFGAASYLATPSFSPYSVCGGDFNNDGKIDVTVAVMGNSTISFFPGNGDGTFGSGVSSGVAMTSRSMNVIDINNDGKLDLITPISSGYQITLLMGNGDGTFTNANSLSAVANPYSLAIADYDGDDVPDIASANFVSNTSGSISVILNKMPFVRVSNASICSAGGSVTLSPTGATTYTITGGSFTVNPSVTTTYTVIGASAAGCNNSREVTVFVGVPTSSSQTLSICSGEFITVGSIVHDTSGVFIDTIANVVGCDSIVTTNLIVNVPSTVSISYPGVANTYCNGSMDTLFASGATTYLWNNGVTSDTLIFTHDYTNTLYEVIGVDANGCYDTTSYPISGVAAAVTVTIDFSGIDSTCVNYSAFPLAGALPLGGTWSGNGVSGQNFDPAMAGVGTHILTYTALNTDNCPYVAADSIFVLGCVGFSDALLLHSITVAPNPNDGNFSIKSASAGQFRIVNELGQLINELELNSNTNYEVIINGLTPGIYFVLEKNGLTKNKIVVTR